MLAVPKSGTMPPLVMIGMTAASGLGDGKFTGLRVAVAKRANFTSGVFWDVPNCCLVEWKFGAGWLETSRIPVPTVAAAALVAIAMAEPVTAAYRCQFEA